MSEWKENTLDDVCLKITDGAHQSPRDFANGLPMFSVKDMENQGFDYSRVKTISKEDFIRLINSGCQPEIDDILIAKGWFCNEAHFSCKKETGLCTAFFNCYSAS